MEVRTVWCIADHSEIKCYGRYMIPPLLVFGVLAIGASLIIVGIHKGWYCEFAAVGPS